jgi:spore coat polysaccharide biosynthesis protein SpsF
VVERKKQAASTDMIVGILQARMSSTRLPGKVLLPLLGRPMMERQIERVRRSRRMDRLIVATTVDPADDAIVALAAELGVECCRGSVDDVLDRYFQAAALLRPSHVVRLTADCPLADWNLIDRAVDFALAGRFDYASNTLRPTWPDGLDVEVMTFSALETAWDEARSPVEREHVTPFIVACLERFRHGSLERDTDLSAMRWTVDEPSDFEFVSRVYEALYPGDPAFRTEDILELLRQRPELMTINQGFDRNEGLRLSIEKYARESSSE